MSTDTCTVKQTYNFMLWESDTEGLQSEASTNRNRVILCLGSLQLFNTTSDIGIESGVVVYAIWNYHSFWGGPEAWGGHMSFF